MNGYDVHISPLKDPPIFFKNGVYHLFRLGISIYGPGLPWRTVSHNQAGCHFSSCFMGWKNRHGFRGWKSSQPWFFMVIFPGVYGAEKFLCPPFPCWYFPCTRPGKRLQKAIENGPVEIVDLPIKRCDFPWWCKRLPKGMFFLRPLFTKAWGYFSIGSIHCQSGRVEIGGNGFLDLLIWVCLKIIGIMIMKMIIIMVYIGNIIGIIIGYIPNEIAICYRDNDQQNHWV